MDTQKKIPPKFLVKDHDLTRSSSFQTPARTRYYYEMREESDVDRLPELFAFITRESFPHIVLGLGTNVLFAFDVYEGVIIRNGLKSYEKQDTTLTLGAGEIISVASRSLAKDHQNHAFLRWSGLPGTVGGAVVGNAGCFGLEIADRLISVRVFDTITSISYDMPKESLGFSYRHSILKESPHLLGLSATFDITPREDDGTSADAFIRTDQPSGRTCGSFFKNPKPLFAGKLIEDAELKGHRIGGVVISEKHGNFFLNTGGATYRDILALRDLVRDTVREKFNITLEEEVRSITNPERHHTETEVVQGTETGIESIRLQKYLSQAGICSRRKAEEYIERGWITINGRVATIGESVLPGHDVVRVQDSVIEEREHLVYYKLHKPRGVVSTCEQP